MSSPQPELSIIVPAYACGTIAEDLQRIHATVSALNIPFELICVIDGLKDNHDTTLEQVQDLHFPANNFAFIYYPQNHGKGYAVRKGFELAEGNVVGFIDAGNDIHVNCIVYAWLTLQKNNSQIIVGSKRHGQSHIHYPLTRRLYSGVLQLLTKIFFQLHVADTQVGLKLFQAKIIKPLLPRCRINRWAFDLELLAVTKHHHPDVTIQEIPVEISYNFQSTLKWHVTVSFLRDFFAIILGLKVLHFYD